MWVIVDIDRTIDPREAVRLVEMAYASREKAGIIGIGLDSQEIGYPASRHKLAFDRAAELGLRRVAHAGEDVGPESVWNTLDSLGVERIDHGVRSIEDGKLVTHLTKTQIPLTVCPVSNIALKIFPDMASHPIKRLMDAGVLVTVNSDDPPMFHSNLIDNYMQVADTFDLTAADVERLVHNSLQAAFVDEATRARYLGRFKAEVLKLRAELFN
jgi:adenosine deaminase